MQDARQNPDNYQLDKSARALSNDQLAIIEKMEAEATEPDTISFEQAIDEVSALYESAKDALNNAYYSSSNAMVREGIDVAMKNNVKMRDYACVAIQRSYGANINQPTPYIDIIGNTITEPEQSI